MILSLMIPLIFAVWLYRYAVRDRLERATRAVGDDSRPATVPAPAPAVFPEDDSTTPDAQRPAWTALDEIQLNRLLREASPP